MPRLLGLGKASGGSLLPEVEGTAQRRAKRRPGHCSSQCLAVAIPEAPIDRDAERVEQRLATVQAIGHDGAAVLRVDFDHVAGCSERRAERVEQMLRGVGRIGAELDRRWRWWRTVRLGWGHEGQAIEQQAAAEAVYGFAGSPLQAPVVSHVALGEQAAFVGRERPTQGSPLARPLWDSLALQERALRIVDERCFDIDDETADETAYVRRHADRVEEEL